MLIVNGKTENHLDMLDNMVIERLLNDKWSSFARVNRHVESIYSALIFVGYFFFFGTGQLCSTINSTLFTFIIIDNCSLLT